MISKDKEIDELTENLELARKQNAELSSYIEKMKVDVLKELPDDQLMARQKQEDWLKQGIEDDGNKSAEDFAHTQV